MTRYRMRVTLIDSEPEIWRVFEVDGRLRLRMLHLALQTIMGWRESHLHSFTDTDPFAPASRGRRWASPDFGPAEHMLSEEDFSVGDALTPTSALWYEYDFGDGWIHHLEIIEQMPDDPDLAPVVLIDGENRGPFENSGGPHGYAEKMEIAADPQHPDHAFISDWLRVTVGPWASGDPSTFDLVGLQSELNLLFDPESAGISPYDMSGLVKSDTHRQLGDVTDASPIAVLASELPPPIRSELRQHLHRTGILNPVHLDDATVERIVRPYGWLMSAVGIDGLALTAAGWMPPSTVLAGMTELGWLDDWVGKGNREELTPPIAHLRETAQRMGLVRVQKQRLLLGAAAKDALGDPRRQLRLIADGLYRKLSDAEIDAAALLLLAIADGTPRGQRWESVAFGLEACGWQSSSRQEFTASDIAHATFHVQRVLDLVGESSRRARRREEDPDVQMFAKVALR